MGRGGIGEQATKASLRLKQVRFYFCNTLGYACPPHRSGGSSDYLHTTKQHLKRGAVLWWAEVDSKQRCFLQPFILKGFRDTLHKRSKATFIRYHAPYVLKVYYLLRIACNNKVAITEAKPWLQLAFAWSCSQRVPVFFDIS